jgi:hypothetical protein
LREGEEYEIHESDHNTDGGLALFFVYVSIARADCGVDLFGKLPAAAALRAPLPTTAMLSSNQQDDKSWFKDDDAGPFGLRIVGLWATAVTQGQTVLLRGFVPIVHHPIGTRKAAEDRSPSGTNPEGLPVRVPATRRATVVDKRSYQIA